MLPGTDGLEICRRLRAQATSRGSPVGKPAGQRYGNLHRPFGAGRFDDDRS
jgi:CheY-like chemotaxis protein